MEDRWTMTEGRMQGGKDVWGSDGSHAIARWLRGMYVVSDWTQ